MERKSELELFLASLLADGRGRNTCGLEVDSQGSFTVSGKEALRKIAEYQLPFAYAWAVKIIASIVAAGSTDDIRVDLTASEIRFYFVADGFTLDEFATAFYTPEPSPNRALRYLLTGLWSVGLKEFWGFQIALPGQAETLIWDGEHLNRVVSPASCRECTCISIAPLRQKAGLSWASGIAASGRRNAELLLVLGRFCYTCPLPLTVDGRRIDSLQRAEHHGWSQETYPLEVGYAEAPTPEFGLPPGTFQGVSESLESLSFGALLEGREGGGWRLVAEKRMQVLRARERASLAYILCLNMKYVHSGQAYVWKAGKGRSTVYWILDGVLIGEDALFLGASHCSLGCFLSAEGLAVDLSTFGLLESTERTQRLILTRPALLAALRSFGDGDFEDLVKVASQPQRLLGGYLLTLGVVVFCAAPFVGVGACLGGCILSGLGGGALRLDYARAQRILVQEARAGLKELEVALENSCR